MSEVKLPNGSSIFPRESVALSNDERVIVHVERWCLWIESPGGWFVASADRMFRDWADGIYFDSLENHDAMYNEIAG